MRPAVYAALLIGMLGLLADQVPAFDRTGGGHLEEYELLFDTQQNQKLEKLATASQPRALPLAEKLKAEQHGLKVLLENEAYAGAQIKSQVSRIAEARYALALEQAAYLRAVRRIATPDQLAGIDALEQKQAEKRAKRHADMRTAMQEAQSGN